MRIVRILAAAIAVVFGVATLFAGGRVLLGADPGYEVFRPLLIFNTVMGAAYVAAGVLVWRGARAGRYAAGAIVLLNLLVLAGILVVSRSGGDVAVESLRAMTLRTVVWLAIFLAAFAGSQQFVNAGLVRLFPDEKGSYENPDVIIAGGDVPDLPESVTCPGALVIYSSWAEVVPNCNGFAGPGAGNNAVVDRALQNAMAVAAQIPCADDCPKHVAEIWRGWKCGGNPRPIVAIGAVEVKILCRIEE